MIGQLTSNHFGSSCAPVPVDKASVAKMYVSAARPSPWRSPDTVRGILGGMVRVGVQKRHHVQARELPKVLRKDAEVRVSWDDVCVKRILPSPPSSQYIAAAAIHTLGALKWETKLHLCFSDQGPNGGCL